MDIEKAATPSLTREDRYRILVEGIIDYAIYMLDPTGVVTSWNKGAQRFKGYADHEIVGQHFPGSIRSRTRRRTFRRGL